MTSKNDAFPFGFRMVSEVDKQPKLVSRRFEIIVDLSPMLVVQLRDCFYLYDDLMKANEVRHIF